MMAQGLVRKQAKESFRFYQVRPDSLRKSKAKYGLDLPKKKKMPSLLPVKKQVTNVWKIKQSLPVTKIPRNQKYHTNSLTFRHHLTTKSAKKDKVIVVGNLVQAFVPTHPLFFGTKKEAALVLDYSEQTIGVSIDNPSVVKLDIPKIPKNTIYPNPTTGVFNIDLEQEATEIKVVNLIGRVVLSQKVKGRSFYGLDISHLPKGTYIASFLQKGKWFSQRLVLVK